MNDDDTTVEDVQDVAHDLGIAVSEAEEGVNDAPRFDPLADELREALDTLQRAQDVVHHVSEDLEDSDRPLDLASAELEEARTLSDGLKDLLDDLEAGDDAETDTVSIGGTLYEVSFEAVGDDFTDLGGINAAGRAALYNGGYTSVEDLEEATAEELAEVQGISSASAERIKAEVDGWTDDEDDDGGDDIAELFG